MHPKSIIAILAAAVSIIQAAPIPDADDFGLDLSSALSKCQGDILGCKHYWDKALDECGSKVHLAEIKACLMEKLFRYDGQDSSDDN